MSETGDILESFAAELGELNDPNISLDRLVELKRSLRRRAAEPGSHQRAAALLSYAAVAAALIRLGERITIRDDQSLGREMLALAVLPWSPPEIASLLSDAAARLGVPPDAPTGSADAILDAACGELALPAAKPSRFARMAALTRTGVLAAFVVIVLVIGNVALWRWWGSDDDQSRASPTAVQPTAPVTSKFEGVHDRADADLIIGWAWDKTQPNTPIKVEIVDGVNPPKTILADVLFPGLVEAKKGNGRHGFVLTTPANLRDGKPHVVTVRVAGTQVELVNTRRTITTSPPAPAASTQSVMSASDARKLVDRIRQGFMSKGDEAVQGADGWYFHSGDLIGSEVVEDPTKEFGITGNGPKDRQPVPAILDFKKELDERGISLILTPLPGKVAIYGDKLDPQLAGAPRLDGYYQGLMEQLRREGVTVVDIYDDWVALRKEGVDPFLKQDTHPSPAGMRVVARRVAEIIRKESWYPAAPKLSGLHVVPRTLPYGADLPLILKENPLPPYEVVQIQAVHQGDQPMASDRQGPIVVMGDSTGAVCINVSDSLGTQLAMELSVGVDTASVAAQAANGSRLLLKRRGDNLAGKKCIVWCFNEMFLALGTEGWLRFRVTDAPVVAAASNTGNSERFYVAPPGGQIVHGVIRSVSAIGDPVKSPYKDHIMTVHLTGLQDERGAALSAGEALVCCWSMRDHVLLPGGKLQPGQTASFAVKPWSDIADSVMGVNRSELADDALLLEEHVWGELQKQ